ncbi:hypothetical protein GGG87_07795 [Streptococcus sp. zg-86]|uniref:Uncharacterized protein n=1 Tax=Streptococcus zhangguiae TaxID=2664091 RepID=A0A6I4RJX4_9STRE|nr:MULTISPECIES: hypothetical protein [unclassified Streptococcus]MTB64896.1 hypothetical protein [Streptococcus sp. zg-86]MTB91034.1 hypothetical protein [Streptococcus sp. zg-36]MWV56883.1 hypothetical protein [Streptococcus sp. zg-70]QTH48316.1 hypothetical protein J5M87_03030 [Streptococcus sp. zg-86]
MHIHSLSGFESILPQTIDGTSQWIFGKNPPYTDPNDILVEELDYLGTELYLFELQNQKVYQPFPKEAMIYLENPVYDPLSDSFGLLRFDFLQHIIQAYQYRPLNQELTLLTTVPFEKAGDLINVRLISSPFTLIKHEIHYSRTHFLWPVEEVCQWETNECLNYLDDQYFYTSKWVEEPEDYEEVIVRERSTHQIIQRQKGRRLLLPNGEYWQFVK